MASLLIAEFFQGDQERVAYNICHNSHNWTVQRSSFFVIATIGAYFPVKSAPVAQARLVCFLRHHRHSSG